MYTHTLMVLQQMSQHSNVFSFQVGRSVLLNNNYCLNTYSSYKIFNQGGNAWNLLDFDDRSAAIIGVDTIKYCHSKSPKPFRASQDTTSWSHLNKQQSSYLNEISDNSDVQNLDFADGTFMESRDSLYRLGFGSMLS